MAVGGGGGPVRSTEENAERREHYGEAHEEHAYGEHEHRVEEETADEQQERQHNQNDRNVINVKKYGYHKNNIKGTYISN